MKVIGITGGIGCGKSAVLDLAARHFDIYIIMADEVAHRLMEPGAAAYEQVTELFGDSILRQDGTIDRSVLAGIVFGNKNKRIVLNSIIHPLVKKEIIDTITRLKAEDRYRCIFVEAALLIEDHYDVFCDELWYVYAPEQLRRRRLAENRGYSRDRIDSIFKSQLPEEAFRQACSQVIDNSKTLDDTLSQLTQLVKSL